MRDHLTMATKMKPQSRFIFGLFSLTAGIIGIPHFISQHKWFDAAIIGPGFLIIGLMHTIDSWKEWREETSMKVFINSPTVCDLDSQIASLAGAQLRFRYPMLKILMDSFSYFGLDNIADIEKSLDEHKDEVIRFAEVRFEDRKVDSLMSGVSLLYLCYLLAGSSGLRSDALDYLKTVPFADEMLWESIAGDAVDVAASKREN